MPLYVGKSRTRIPGQGKNLGDFVQAFKNGFDIFLTKNYSTRMISNSVNVGDNGGGLPITSFRYFLGIRGSQRAKYYYFNCAMRKKCKCNKKLYLDKIRNKQSCIIHTLLLLRLHPLHLPTKV